MNRLKEIWQYIALLIVGLAVVYFGAVIIDKSPIIQSILQLFGVLFLIDIIRKIIMEDRKKKEETRKFEKVWDRMSLDTKEKIEETLKEIKKNRDELNVEQAMIDMKKRGLDELETKCKSKLEKMS